MVCKDRLLPMLSEYHNFMIPARSSSQSMIPIRYGSPSKNSNIFMLTKGINIFLI